MVIVKNLVQKKMVSCENASEFCLVFYILESIVEVDGNSVGTFGIQVDKLNLDETVVLESERIFDITLEKAEIEEFANTISDCDVEPIILSDVVCDFVGV